MRSTYIVTSNMLWELCMDICWPDRLSCTFPIFSIIFIHLEDLVKNKCKLLGRIQQFIEIGWCPRAPTSDPQKWFLLINFQFINASFSFYLSGLLLRHCHNVSSFFILKLLLWLYELHNSLDAIYFLHIRSPSGPRARKRWCDPKSFCPKCHQAFTFTKSGVYIHTSRSFGAKSQVNTV